MAALMVSSVISPAAFAATESTEVISQTIAGNEDVKSAENILIENDLRTGEKKEIIVESSPDNAIRYTPSKTFTTQTSELIGGTSTSDLLGSPGIVPNWNYVPTLCYLEITFPNGPAKGTGFIVGTHTVVTAGHCLYNTGKGGYAQKVVVSPMRYKNNSPKGTFETTKIAVPRKWEYDKNYDYDYGIITVNADISESAGGMMGYRDNTNVALQGKEVRALGYKDTALQYVSAGTITTAYAKSLVTNALTEPGNSGGPVTLNTTNNNIVADGISSRCDGRNEAVAVRINKEIYDAISLYAKK